MDAVTEHLQERGELVMITTMILIIVAIILARIIEAYRDAEAFEKPTEGRSTLWHLLKFPQYILWIFVGASATLFDSGAIKYAIYIALGVFIAGIIFEFIALPYFRRLMKCYQ